MFVGIPAGTENQNVVAPMVEFDPLEQKETYESAACGPLTDSDLNIRNFSIFYGKEKTNSCYLD